MRHGIDGYFDEIARFERRLSAMLIVVAALFLTAEFVARQPEIVRALNDPKRFGFEGQEQLVRRILLEQRGVADLPGRSQQTLVPVDMRRGSSGPRNEHAHRQGPRPVEHVAGPGVGDDPQDLQARLRALALDAPVVRSEDLVVERLVRPDYPDEARDQNLEGSVELVALVDTTGEVREVHIVGGSHLPAFDRAATDAVLQCRYRPYSLGVTKERVWALFRIAFRFY